MGFFHSASLPSSIVQEHRFLSVATALGLLSLQVPAPPNTLVADLDGDGAAEKVTVEPRGKSVRIELRDSQGKVLAKSPAPAPASGKPEVALRTGSLGSAGALLEVIASSGSAECRSLWRYRGGTLSRLPITGRQGPLPDCATGEGWSYRWDRPNELAPAIYVRERSRETPDGVHHQLEVFQYTGFRLELDAVRSTAEIGGIPIPGWNDAVLYPKTSLEGLYARFDLSALKSAPRLRILADRAQGIFALRFEDAAGERRLPVTAASPEGKNEVVLKAGPASQAARARVGLAGDGTVPVEVAIEGLRTDLDRLWVPVTRLRASAVRIFPSAEDELATEELVGTWADEKGGQMTVTLLSGPPAVLRFGRSEVSVNVVRAPEGVDALLVPRDGSLPTLGVTLRGSNAMNRVPVRCAAERQKGRLTCQRQGPGDLLQRIGARLNAR